MKYMPNKIMYIFTIASVLSGCFNGVSSHQPTKSVQTYDFIQGAFTNGDHLYLLGNERDYELPKAPFLEYKKLTDSHLKNDIACYSLSSTLYQTKALNNHFEGTYRVLLRGKNVTAQDIKTYKLSALPVATTDRVAENRIWSKFAAQDCGLDKVQKENYYVAEFSATGKSLYLSNKVEALKQAKLQNKINMDIFIVRDSSKPEKNRSLSETVEVAVKAPMYILGIIFAR